MCTLQRGPSYQVSLHLAEGFQRRRLKCEKLTDDRRRTPSDGKSSYCLWQGLLKSILKCEYLLVMYRINMLHYYQHQLISKGDNGKSYFSFNSLGTSYLSFNRRFFRNQPIRNKNCLWQPCLLTDWDKISNLYRGPSIDAPYHVSVHLAEGFQRRRLKCER